MICAVAAALVKDSVSSLNIQCVIRKYECVSEEEAIGKFVIEMNSFLEKHHVHARPVVVILLPDKEAKR